MKRAQVIIALTFVGIFGAGVVSALVANRYTDSFRGKPQDRRGPTSFMAERLGLTPEQHEKMREIWSSAREQMGQQNGGRRALQQQRDEELLALLSPDQKKQLDAINARHDARMAELREAGDKLMRLAEQKTRDILTPEQRLKYDEFLKERASNDRGGGGDRGGRGGPSSSPFPSGGPPSPPPGPPPGTPPPPG